MASDKQFSAYGITEIGSFTGTKGGTYTETSWGVPAQDGATLTSSVNTVKQRAGNSGSVLHSFISEVDAQLRVALASAALDSLRRGYGLPTTALIGDLDGETPAKEVLTVKASELGTEEFGIYIRTRGRKGPRTYYVPRCKAASLPELNMNRSGYTEPNVTFDVYENDDGELFWIEDAVA